MITTMREEVKQREYNFLAKGHKKKELTSEQIERDTAEWLAKGNAIEPAAEYPDVKSRRAY